MWQLIGKDSEKIDKKDLKQNTKLPWAPIFTEE